MISAGTKAARAPAGAPSGTTRRRVPATGAADVASALGAAAAQSGRYIGATITAATSQSTVDCVGNVLDEDLCQPGTFENGQAKILTRNGIVEVCQMSN